MANTLPDGISTRITTHPCFVAHYVHYYDRYEKLPDENPTIGILLCKEKDDALVEITLPENSNIYASEYQLYLPDKKELQKKLKEWIAEETGGEES